MPVYTCEKCGKEFKYPSVLKKHMNRKTSCKKVVEQPSNLFDLLKNIKSNDIDKIFEEICKTQGEKGNLYEKIWDIIIKCGCHPKFNNRVFRHMYGNINLGKMDIIKDLEYYLKKNKTFSKNKGGSSDITLQKNDDTWIFISSKLYKDDNNHSIKDYEVQDILKEINEYKHIYKKYEIWLVVNDKIKVQKIIKFSQHTNDTISKNINGILDLNDLKKYYLLLQKELQKINLNNKGELNNRFCNSMEKLQLRFHQDLMTSQTLNKISEGEKTILWGWKCRAGKTFGVGGLLLKYYKKFNQCNCLIITPAPTETISQFVNDMFNRYRDFNYLNINEVKSGNELKSLLFKDNNNNNIIICSKQLLDDYITEDTKIQNIIDLNLDLIIFDENHFGGCSKLSKDIISTYSTDNTIKLFLTATFQKPLLEWNIPQHCQFYWNIEDEQLCKKRNIKGLVNKHGEEVLDFINEDNKEDILTIYDKMPNLELITTMMDSYRYNLIREQIKDTNYGFSMNVLFSLTKNDKFNFSKEVEDILSYISGSSMGALKDKKSIFERIKTISRNKDSRTTLCNQNFTTQLWFLPFGQGMKINNVSKCLKLKMSNDQILKYYEIMIINSNMDDKLKNLKDDINKKEKEAKANGKLGLILLAGNQCSLGITLPLCDIVVLLNNTLSVDKILQMMYRCMSESSDGSKKCGFVVDLNISRVLNTLLEYNINKKDTTIQNKFTYLIENNLINIDSDLFIGKEKQTKYGVKLVTKLLDIWKSDPINHHKRLLKKIENSIIELNNEDQKLLNTYFTSSGKSNNSVEIKFDDDNDQDLPTGNKKIKVLDKDKKENIEEEDDEEDTIKISLTKDILPFVIPLSCILTMNNNQMDFIKMLENIKQNNELLEVFNTQSTIWWNKKDRIELINKIVKKYIKKNSKYYNIAIQFKMSLQSLIDRPKELLELINSCLKPKKIEKKKFGEVFTPMSIINEMLDNLDEYYTKKHSKSIFEEKNFKWLDPANGMGNFPIGVYYRLMGGLKEQIIDKEERKKHILENMLYMSEFNKKNVFVSRQIFDIENKYELNLYCGDSLTLDTEKEWGVKEFDVVIGNPPYNKELKKSGATAFYNEFVEKFIDTCKYHTFIIPSRWFAGGKGLKKFRENMLKRKDIVYIRHFDNASKIFGNSVDIKGGVNYYLKSYKYDGDCNYNGNMIKLNSFDILVDSKFYNLINKINNYKNLQSIFITQNYYNLQTNSKKLKNTKKNDNFRLCYVSKQKGFIKYVDENDIDNKNIKKWKVITARTSHKGNSGFGNIFIGKQTEVHTKSYISFNVDTKKEAESLLSYLQCKIPNLLLSIRKMSIDISGNTCKWIPLPPLDRTWTDEKIYNYYKLTEIDIKLIKETKIVGYK